MKRLLWVMAFALLAVIAVIGLSLSPDALTRWVRRDVAVAIGGKAISETDLRQALRDDLWRQSQTWKQLSPAAQAEARQQTLEKLIDEQLVRHYRTHSTPLPTANEAAVQTELTMWQKQFQEAAEGSQRLALQQLTAPSLEAEMRARQLDQAWIEQQIAASMAAIPIDEAQDWYVQHRETLRIPAAYRAAHIYLTRHDKAKPDREPEIRQLYQQLTTGKATLAQLAAQFSDDDRSKLRGGDLDWFTAARMPADFIAAVEPLKVGQTSAPVLTALGWHIIKLTARQPATIPPFSAVRAEIETALLAQKRAAALSLLLQNLRQRADSEGLIHRHADVIYRAMPASL